MLALLGSRIGLPLVIGAAGLAATALFLFMWKAEVRDHAETRQELRIERAQAALRQAQIEADRARMEEANRALQESTRIAQEDRDRLMALVEEISRPGGGAAVAGELDRLLQRISRETGYRGPAARPAGPDARAGQPARP